MLLVRVSGLVGSNLSLVRPQTLDSLNPTSETLNPTPELIIYKIGFVFAEETLGIMILECSGVRARVRA